MRFLETILAVALLLFVIAFTANTQQLSDSEYTAQALSAAPEGVAKDAAVVRMESNGSMRTIRAGSNGFTCMVMGTDRMSNDANRWNLSTP